MASKYTLQDLPTSGTYIYKGKMYPKWDVDGLNVSNNQLWNVMGLNDDTFDPDNDAEGKLIEHDCIVWTDETKPIDEICEIASQQGGSGTPEKIVADTEKRIVQFLGLVSAVKKWHTRLDGEDGATAGLWEWIPMSMIPSATEDDWMHRLLCDRVDPYIGCRGELNPPADVGKIMDGDLDEVKRLDDWARTRAQEIYDGCRIINEELIKEKAEESEKKARDEEENRKSVELGKIKFGIRFYVVFKGEMFVFKLDDKNELGNFFECADDPKMKGEIIGIYTDNEEKPNYPSWYDVGMKRISRDDAVKIALGIEAYLNKEEE